MILYQKVAYQIAFLIDEQSAGEIANWERETPYSDEELKLLQGAADGSPSYHLTFFVVGERVHLTVRRTLNYTFYGSFEGRESNDLVYLDSMPCPQVIREPKTVVLKIEGEVYQTLINWENWVDAEAFTGRYTYEFFENGTFDYKYIIVLDTATREKLVLDDSWSLWR